jgi:hypothetical protein
MKMNISIAQRQAHQLLDSLRDFLIGPNVVDRERDVIWGVNDKGVFVDGMTADRFLARACKIILDSKRVYLYGNSIVYETREDAGGALTTLTVECRAETHAPPVLSNLFVTGVMGKQGPIQSLAAPKLVHAVLADESLAHRLPVIRHYGRRPTFDPDFMLCHPGWNQDAGILVHGPDIAPVPGGGADTAGGRPLDRLPPRLRELLREFDWRSDADLVNAVAMLLTGLLSNHFIDDPHPAGIVDGNQSQLGKTLLVQSIGRVLDDIEPPRIPLVNDEAVEKRLCAQVRCSRASLFFFDNVRARIESAVLEQNILSPVVTFRILGKSATIERPNGYLWMITSNLTAGTPDFISRGIPIRLFYEGDPKQRKFEGDPLACAARHRLVILGELAGMVLRWVEAGRPPGGQKHRCRRWAETIGGILDVAGLGASFLANAAEAEAEMDQGLLDLATLAEHAVARDSSGLYVDAGSDPEGKGKPAGQWVEVAQAVGILREKLAECSGAKARATLVGNFLGGKVDRQVPIETPAGPRTATLRMREGRARARHYYFAIAATGEAGDPADPAPTEEGPAPESHGATTPPDEGGEMTPEPALALEGPGDGPEWL